MFIKDARQYAKEKELIQLLAAGLDTDFDYARTEDRTVYAKGKLKYDNYQRFFNRACEEDQKSCTRILNTSFNQLTEREKYLYVTTRFKGYTDYRSHYGSTAIATAAYAAKYNLTKFEAEKICFSIKIITESLQKISNHYSRKGLRHPRIVLDINDTRFSEGVKNGSPQLDHTLFKLSLYIKEYLGYFTYRSKAVDHLQYNLGYLRLEKDELHIANFLIKL